MLYICVSGEGAGWGPQARLPAPGQLCYESLQIARYQAGQHFRPHEVRSLAKRLWKGRKNFQNVLLTSIRVGLP
jgi:hypothetical protein